MTTPLWQGGTVYLPGDLVQPVITPTPSVDTTLTNAGFESGSTDWTLGTGFAITSDLPFTGAQSAKHTGTGTSTILHAAVVVTPGTIITASCMYAQGTASAGDNTGQVLLQWLDSGSAVISTSLGTLIESSNNSTNYYKSSTVTATAPTNAAYVRIGGNSIKTVSDPVWFDAFSWNYSAPSFQAGLIYQAVQAAAGSSGTVEPIWPTVLGGTVVDNEVTWEAVYSTRVEWTATSILESQGTEPKWPTQPGATVSDGDIAWECITRNVTDEKCPNTRVVVIGASKVFAVDDDIVAFSATVNPLDWSTANDAGFLPTGLQQYGANEMAVLALYRGNLAAFNSQGVQMWQIDQDPSRMAFLDSMPVGSTHPKGCSPVSNDLFFMTELGVRSVGIAVGAQNMQAGDLGAPIDPLIQAALRTAAALDPPRKALSTYYPSEGQYFVTFSDIDADPFFITGTLPDTEEDIAYSERLQINGGVAPYSNPLIISGEAPLYTELTIDGDEIVVTWPFDAICGPYQFVVQVQDSDGRIAQSYQSPRVISTLAVSGTVPDALEGVAVSVNLPITGGVEPYISATITSGALPAGGTVTIVGTNCVVAWPDTAPAGSYTFTITIEDSNECEVTSDQTPAITEFPENWWLVSRDSSTVTGITLNERLWRADTPGDWGTIFDSVERDPRAAGAPEAMGFLGEVLYIFGGSSQAEKYTNYVPADPQVGTVVSLASPSALFGGGNIQYLNDMAATPNWVTIDGGATIQTITAPTGGNADGNILAITVRPDGRWIISIAKDGGGDYALWYSDEPDPQDGDWIYIGNVGTPNVSILFFLNDGTNIVGMGNTACATALAATAGASWTTTTYGAEWDAQQPRCGYSHDGTFMVGTYGGTSARIMRSDDGGATWAAVAVGTADAGIIESDIEFMHYGGGWWVASSAGLDGAMVYGSNDDGLTWQVLDVPRPESNQLWIPIYVGVN